MVVIVVPVADVVKDDDEVDDDMEVIEDADEETAEDEEENEESSPSLWFLPWNKQDRLDVGSSYGRASGVSCGA